MKCIGHQFSVFAKFIILMLIFFVCNLAGQKSESKIAKCRVNSKESVKYKLISARRLSLLPHILELRIVLKQEDFNRPFFTNLAKTLKARYCLDKRIGVSIFDEKRAAKTTDIAQYILGKIKVPEVRGFYSLDREKNSEVISYSTKRGKPDNEVVLTFAPN